MRPIKVGVIGLGHMGEFHLLTFLKNPDLAEVVGFMDIDETRAQEIMNKYNVDFYSKVEELLPKVDAVSIATPEDTHFQIAKNCILSGKHVLLEKPMATSSFEAFQLLKLAERNNAIFALGHIERFNPVVSEMTDYFRNEEPLHLEISREAPFSNRSAGTNIIFDVMIHDIDLLYFIFNEVMIIESVHASKGYSRNPDVVTVQLITESGRKVKMSASKVASSKVRQWKAIHNDQIVVFDLLNGKITRKYRDNHLIVENKNIPPVNQLTMEIRDFLNSILESKKPKATGMDGLKAVDFASQLVDRLTHVSLVNFYE